MWKVSLSLDLILCFAVIYKGSGYDVEPGAKENGSFEKWLQCYQNPRMRSLTDRNKRTIWFDGEPGPLIPNGKQFIKASILNCLQLSSKVAY